mmetsp:Transcript_12802/g.37643  ORF Transcript_12802/g.37643 Transcript_12802/m.37643 type:complete len:253 (-) Transcript_12802:620-1378(-)
MLVLLVLLLGGGGGGSDGGQSESRSSRGAGMDRRDTARGDREGGTSARYRSVVRTRDERDGRRMGHGGIAPDGGRGKRGGGGGEESRGGRGRQWQRRRGQGEGTTLRPHYQHQGGTVRLRPVPSIRLFVRPRPVLGKTLGTAHELPIRRRPSIARSGVRPLDRPAPGGDRPGHDQVSGRTGSVPRIGGDGLSVGGAARDTEEVMQNGRRGDGVRSGLDVLSLQPPRCHVVRLRDEKKYRRGRRRRCRRRRQR